MERYYQPEIECASREQIHQWQSERLVKQVQNVCFMVKVIKFKMVLLKKFAMMMRLLILIIMFNLTNKKNKTIIIHIKRRNRTRLLINL